MSATKRKSYNSLDKKMKEDDDETKTLEMEEGGISKAKDEEKQIQNLLDDTDQLIGNKKSDENNDDVDMNEIKPLINNKKEKTKNYNKPKRKASPKSSKTCAYTPS